MSTTATRPTTPPRADCTGAKCDPLVAILTAAAQATTSVALREWLAALLAEGTTGGVEERRDH